MRKTLAVGAITILLVALLAGSGVPAATLLLVCVGAAPLAVILFTLGGRRLDPAPSPLLLSSPDRAPPRRRQA